MAFRVKATRLGYYGDLRRRPGDIFWVQKQSEFSSLWMEKEDPSRDAEVVSEESPRPRGKGGRPKKVSDAQESVI